MIVLSEWKCKFDDINKWKCKRKTKEFENQQMNAQMNVVKMDKRPIENYTKWAWNMYAWPMFFIRTTKHATGIVCIWFVSILWPKTRKQNEQNRKHTSENFPLRAEQHNLCFKFSEVNSYSRERERESLAKNRDTNEMYFWTKIVHVYQWLLFSSVKH